MAQRGAGGYVDAGWAFGCRPVGLQTLWIMA